MIEELGPGEIPIDEAQWITVVFPELGAGARSVVHYVEPIDGEFRRTGLGYVFVTVHAPSGRSDGFGDWA